MANTNANPNPNFNITKVSNEGNKTLDDILQEMNSLWSKAKKEWTRRKLSEADHASLDEIYDSFRPEHPQLYSSYPTVVKHALMEMNYHPEAFRKYLKRLQSKPWLNDEQRLESYADYAVLLFKALNPKRWQPEAMAAFRTDYLNKLTTEHKKFEEMYRKHAEKLAAEEKQFDKERREELMKVLSQLKALRESAQSQQPDCQQAPQQ